MRSFVGIDLGTTFSVVARIDEHGKPVIVYDDQGKNLTPSCVYRNPDSGDIRVDKFARQEVYSGIGENAAARFKRKMGTSEIYTLGGKEYTPTDLSSLVLEDLIRSRAGQIGEIEEGVVTVPANFANEAREATMEAAQRAGLKVNYIINEPTAAALYYSFKEGMDLEGTYAVYDLGGGTFDISIIRIKGKDVEVLTSNGVHELGGIDFDEMLKTLVDEKYQIATGDPPELDDFTFFDAEEQKEALSKVEMEKVNVKVVREVVEVTRKEFEELISAKVTQAEMLCESTLDEVGLKSSDIRGVLCAGGSTRIPMVQASIKRVFDQDPIFKANVDEVVALGAALYAAYRGDREKLSLKQREVISGMGLTERTGQYYGTITLSKSDSGIRKVNSVLIKKNTVIPCEASELYYTVSEGQTLVNCAITEAPSEETDLTFVKKIKSGKLSLPPGRPVGQEIKVTFKYDENQTMHCFFEDIGSGESIEMIHKVESTSDIDSDIDDFTVE